MRFLEVELTSLAPERAVSFYADTLGLPREGDDAVRAGPSVLRFGPGPGGPYHVAFNVPENRIEDAFAWLGGRAELFGDGVVDFPNWDAHATYFADADGNVAELIARHRLPNATDEPFGPGLLLELSEVGLPVPDTGATVSALEQTFGVDVFSGNRDTFTAVGGEHGLLIVVHLARPWFPTDRVALAAPLAVRLEAPRSGELSVPGTEYRLAS